MRRCRSRPRPGTSSMRSTSRLPQGTSTVVCFGDSITDGTGSTLNGDDRWPDVFARRLHAAYGPRFAVVNAGIGGNRITGPTPYDPKAPFAGGPSALDRLERDVLSLSAVSTIIWLEGHQRPVVGHQRRGGHRRDQGRRAAHPRARRHSSHRRHHHARARRHERRRHAGRRRAAKDRQRVHPLVRHLRRRRRLRCRDARCHHWRPAGRVPAQQQHRRPGRRAAPQSRRLSGDGQRGRSEDGRARRAQVRDRLEPPSLDRRASEPRAPSPEPRAPSPEVILHSHAKSLACRRGSGGRADRERIGPPRPAAGRSVRAA